MPLDPKIGEIREAYSRASAEAAERWDLALVEDSDLCGLPVRIYSTSDDETLPSLVYLHGGRFFSGGLDTHDGACRALAAHSGWRIVAVDYRLAPEYKFPTPLVDSLSVAAHLSARGATVGIGGDSAGGGLAAAAAIALRDSGVALACQLLIYPMLDATCSLPSHVLYASGYGPSSDDMKRGWVEYLPSDADLRDPRISPLWAEDLTGLPPTFILAAELDSLRDEGERYAERLREAGVPVTHSLLEGANHGVFTRGGLLESGREGTRRAGEWLRFSNR